MKKPYSLREIVSLTALSVILICASELKASELKVEIVCENGYEYETVVVEEQNTRRVIESYLVTDIHGKGFKCNPETFYNQITKDVDDDEYDTKMPIRTNNVCYDKGCWLRGN